MTKCRVTVVGGGLAGCEAALQLLSRGYGVDMYEMRPGKSTGAHTTGDLAELVCSNSLKSEVGDTASATLKEELDALVAKNPQWGKIVCRCEKVTEAEIVAAVHSPLPAATVDAVKRRVRAGMGRCQGGFCSTRVMEIISRELGIPMRDIRKGAGHSEIAVLAVKEADYEGV